MELRIRGIFKVYANGAQAMKDMALTTPAGRYGLLGPNGAGKSALQRFIATLQEPSTDLVSAAALLGSQKLMRVDQALFCSSTLRS